MATTITTVITSPSIDDLQPWGNIDTLPFSLDSEAWQTCGIYELSIADAAQSSDEFDGDRDIGPEILYGEAQSGGTLEGFFIFEGELDDEAEASGTMQCEITISDALHGIAEASGALDGVLVSVSSTLIGEAFSDGVIAQSATAIQTHQDKVDAGYETWLEPALTTATYTEIVDVTGDPNTMVEATNIVVTVTWTTISGNPSLACKIETSTDGENWDVETANGFAAFAENFRYCRYTFTVTGGYISISNINYRLDVKRKADFGRVQCNANDNGTGWISEADTPMLTGTWVDFGVSFVDVESIPRPNIVKLDGGAGIDVISGLTAFVVFEDVPHPTGFRIFVKDKNGDRASALVDWAAYGV